MTISITLEQIESHLINLKPDIKKAFDEYYGFLCPIPTHPPRKVKMGKAKRDRLEKILGMEIKADRYFVFKNAGLIWDLNDEELYILDGARTRKSCLYFFDGNNEPWEADLEKDYPKEKNIKSKKEIVTGKLGCDARKRLGGGGG